MNKRINRRLKEVANVLFTGGIVRAVRYNIIYTDKNGVEDVWEYSVENQAYMNMGSDGFIRIINMRIKA